MSSDDDDDDGDGGFGLGFGGGLCRCAAAAAVGCLGGGAGRRGGGAAAPEGDNESRLDRNASMPSTSGLYVDDSNDSSCCFRCCLVEGSEFLLVGVGALLLDAGEGFSLRLGGCERFGPPINPLRFSCGLLLPARLADCVCDEKLRVPGDVFFVLVVFDLAVFFLDFFETMAFRYRLRSFSCVLGPSWDQLLKTVTSFRQVRMSRVLARVMAT